MKRPSLSDTHDRNTMKRVLLAVFVLIMSLDDLSAQDHKPTTSWPYLYADFRQGELKKNVGAPIEGTYNIHLHLGTLHFIEDGMIREALSTEIFSVKIGMDYYANVGGTMMKVLARSDNGFVAQEVLADMAALNATGGAYGSSSSSIATQALSSMEGIGGTRSNMNHMELKNSKDEGQILPVIEKLYLVMPDMVIYAARKDVYEIDGTDRKALNAFIKENKIRWKDPQSLIRLLDYIYINRSL